MTWNAGGYSGVGARMWTRRQMLGSLSWLVVGCAGERHVAAPGARRLAEIEEDVGGRVGVFATSTATGREMTHRADERFAMCSTFKWVLAAAILRAVDRGELTLDRQIAYGPADLLEYAPTTRARVGEGGMSVEALAAAAVTVSDNTAANLLLPLVGGPAGLTAFFRSLGDEVSRLDRNEPELNTNIADDPRDTTTPRAMATAMKSVVVGDALSQPSRERLIGWLVGCETCGERLRAGFPDDWRVGDKTGTGTGGAVNDVAIAWPRMGGPLLVAAYFSGSSGTLAELSAAHAAIARAVAAELAP